VSSYPPYAALRGRQLSVYLVKGVTISRGYQQKRLMKTHKDLDVWKKSIVLTKMIYEFTEKLPKSEKYGLISQMRRTAVSVPSNVAEGAGRNSNAELRNFVNIALGSLTELETQIILCKELSLVKIIPKELSTTFLDVRKLLNGLKRSLKIKK